MGEKILGFFQKTFGSRKFWAAVAAAIPFGLQQDWQNFAMVWLVYIGAVGVVDASREFSLPPKKEGD